MATATVGDKIRTLRNEREMSQEKLAVELGVSWSTINRYERGITTPSLNRLHLIAEVLGVPTASLLGDDTKDAA